MKQGGITHYKDYRHKLSKRSAHHRVKRSQQLLEAQRLLDNHNVDTTSRQGPIHNSLMDKSKLVYKLDDGHNGSKDKKGNNYSDNDDCDDDAQSFITNKKYVENQVLHKITKSKISRQQNDNQGMERKVLQNIDSSVQEVMCGKRDSMEMKFYKAQDEIADSSNVGRTRINPELGKIEILKQRMEKRRQKRRQSQQKLSTLKDTFASGARRNDGTTPSNYFQSSNVKDGGIVKSTVKDEYRMTKNTKNPSVDVTEQTYNKTETFHKHDQSNISDKWGKAKNPNNFDDTSSLESSNNSVKTTLSEEMQQEVDKTYHESDSGEASHDDSVVSIELIYCEHCKKSYAPETSKKFCQALDKDGNPKCLKLGGSKKRKVFNSAKMRILNNTHLQPEEQRVVISGRKKVVAEMRQKARGKRSTKKSDKWRQQSEDFREAMKSNRLVAKAQREGKPAHYYL